MVRTYEEYIKLLEAELKSHNYNELSESEISAFIKKYRPEFLEELYQFKNISLIKIKVWW